MIIAEEVLIVRGQNSIPQETIDLMFHAAFVCMSEQANMGLVTHTQLQNQN